MKTVIVEDDFTSRMILQEILKTYGSTHIAVNGKEAVAAVKAALDEEQPYDLICLDIMMPEMDGQEALRMIRQQEEAMGILSNRGAKIIMTTALDDARNVMSAFNSLCDGYLTKPIKKATLIDKLKQLEVIN